MNENSILKLVGSLESSLRDVIGVIPKDQRHWVEDDIAALEKLIRDHSQALQKLRRIQLLSMVEG